MNASALAERIYRIVCAEAQVYVPRDHDGNLAGAWNCGIADAATYQGGEFRNCSFTFQPYAPGFDYTIEVTVCRDFVRVENVRFASSAVHLYRLTADASDETIAEMSGRIVSMMLAAIGLTHTDLTARYAA